MLIAFIVSGYSQSPSNDKKRYRVTALKTGANSTSSLSNIAETYPKPLFYIPSAFTPNGDGLNDSFGVKAEGIGLFKLQIFNRWGELVFESDDIYEFWDGTYLGKRITSTDVFVYQVKAVGKNNVVLPEERGNVTLVAEGLPDQ
jgi:gliding motility-associated-like protein